MINNNMTKFMKSSKYIIPAYFKRNESSKNFSAIIFGSSEIKKHLRVNLSVTEYIFPLIWRKSRYLLI